MSARYSGLCMVGVRFILRVTTLSLLPNLGNQSRKPNFAQPCQIEAKAKAKFMTNPIVSENYEMSIGRTQRDTDTDTARQEKRKEKQRQKEFRMHNYVYRCRYQLVEVGINKIEKIFRGAICNECVCILLCSDRLLLSLSTKGHCWRYRVPRPSLSSHLTCSTLRLSWYAHGCNCSF